jgi:6-phosphogluconolactonase
MITPSEGPYLQILGDPEAVAERAAEWLTEAAAQTDSVFALALSGGSTPKKLYERLATPRWRDAIPWERTHVFWGDERFVPPDDPRSNFRMAHEALLSRVPIPQNNIHPVATQSPSAEEAASAYQRELKTFYGTGLLTPARPLFDATLLGLGTDGHLASLFPGSPALGEHSRWVAAAKDSHGLKRITLTYPALDSSRRLAFLVTGEEKSAALARLLNGDRALPAAYVRPVGELWLFVDADAARALD